MQYTKVEASNGTHYAYRRLGKRGTIPIVFLKPFRSNWDPVLVSEIAAEREVILFDASGSGLSTGTAPSSFRQLGRDALAFIDALGLAEVDLFDASGVSDSTGHAPPAFRYFGTDAVAFIDTVGLTEADLFAFSIDGFVAHEVALQRPELVRRLVLAFLFQYPHTFADEVNTFLSE